MARPPRIGILTFHRCINYGSYWQARCLVEGLRARGADAVLMDHRSPNIDRAEWRCALQPIPSDTRDRETYARKTRRFLDHFEKLPLSEPFPLDEPAAAGRYDLTLVGSDEVWNLRHPWYGGKSIFYGHGVNTGRLASYAASFGNQNYGLQPEWSRQLDTFDAIAVRDDNSRQIVSDAIEREPQLVLDPCLQFSEQIEVVAVPIDAPYVAVYGHSFPDWYAAAIRGWADAHGLTLVSIGYRNDWADRQWIDADPLEFAGFIAGSVAVATNFFHGCVFSLVNNKPFVCSPSDYRNNKVRDLLALVDESRRLLTPEISEVEHLLTPPSTGTYRTIDELRHDSERYLDHVLH